jgi:hypothetical protein
MAYGTVNADVIGTSVAGSNIGAGNASTMKNRIINGAMVIDQRNAGAAVTINSAGPTYTVDRWKTYNNTDAIYTVQQDSSAPAGFNNSVKLTVTTADSSLGAAQNAWYTQAIEGYNIADLNFGSSNAKTVTMSFWVKSSLTGTFNASILNSGTDRVYLATYTINAANTWEQKTITITGCLDGTWLTTNGIGMYVFFNLASGSNYTGTINTWNTSYVQATSGASQVLSTLNATWAITGVQLEVGSSATGFEYRQYQQELALCQRYFDKTFPTNTAPIQNYGRAGALETLQVRGVGAGTVSSYFRFAVPMRATPTMTFFNPSAASNQARNLDTSLNCTDTSADNISEIGGKVFYTTTSGSSSTNINSVHWTASAEL